MQTCPGSSADDRDASFEVDVAEMSGRVHRIAGLSAQDQLTTLLVKVADALGHSDGGVGLVLGDTLLTDDHRCQTMCELGVTTGKVLTAVRMKGSLIYEFSGLVGDEDEHPYATNDTVVHVCFLGGTTCVLVRRTSRRIWHAGSDSFQGSCTYDICRGSYRMTELGAAICSWEQQFRRVRSGTTRTSTFSVNDSGWIRRDAVPQALRKIEIQDGGKWTKQHGMVIDGERVLGVRMNGKGGAAEVIETLALA